MVLRPPLSLSPAPTMPFQVVCSGCAKKLNAPDELEGKTISCPRCGKKLKLPTIPVVEEAPPEPAHAPPVLPADAPAPAPVIVPYYPPVPAPYYPSVPADHPGNPFTRLNEPRVIETRNEHRLRGGFATGFSVGLGYMSAVLVFKIGVWVIFLTVIAGCLLLTRLM